MIVASDKQSMFWAETDTNDVVTQPSKLAEVGASVCIDKAKECLKAQHQTYAGNNS